MLKQPLVGLDKILAHKDSGGPIVGNIMRLLSTPAAIAIADEIIAGELPEMEDDPVTLFGNDGYEDDKEHPTLLESWRRYGFDSTDGEFYRSSTFMDYLKDILKQKLHMPKTVKHIATELDKFFEHLVGNMEVFTDGENSQPRAARIFHFMSQNREALEAICPQLKTIIRAIYQFRPYPLYVHTVYEKKPEYLDSRY